MEELTSGVNWTAVIVGAVVSFLASYLIYSPRMFGTKWAAGVGVTMNEGDKPPMGALASWALGLFLMSWFVGVTAVNSALLTVILATLAFTVLAYSAGMFVKKSSYARKVDAGGYIVSLVIMIICQGIFRGM